MRGTPFRWTHKIILAANFAFCVTGLFVPTLPSWRMFDRIPDPRYELVDAAGRRHRVEDYMPRDAYGFRPDTLVAVARFICDRERAQAPFALAVGERRFVIERNETGCHSREQGGAGH